MFYAFLFIGLPALLFFELPTKSPSGETGVMSA
jgi:hypothetical protein